MSTRQRYTSFYHSICWCTCISRIGLYR